MKRSVTINQDIRNERLHLSMESSKMSNIELLGVLTSSISMTIDHESNGDPEIRDYLINHTIEWFKSLLDEPDSWCDLKKTKLTPFLSLD